MADSLACFHHCYFTEIVAVFYTVCVWFSGGNDACEYNCSRREVFCVVYFSYLSEFNLIYSLRQAALAVMAVTSCSFHQAFLSLLQPHTAQQPFFPLTAFLAGPPPP